MDPATALLAGRGAGLAAETAGRGLDAARKAAEDFESVFLTTMLSSMFAGIGENTGFDGGAGETPFRSMLVEAYARTIADAGGVGLKDQVLRELVQLQELGR